MKRVCKRCGGEGHFAKTCARGGVPWARHMLETGRCRRCGEVRENSAVYCERCRLAENARDSARRAAAKLAVGLVPGVRAPQRCGDCGMLGHNSRTCPTNAIFCRGV